MTMRKAKRWTLIGGGVLVLLALIGAGAFMIPAVQDRAVSFFVKQQASTDPVAMEGDGIRVILCGIAPPTPSPHARTCTAVVAGKRIIIVDTGSGSANNLAQWNFPMEQVSAVLLTHFHSDHISDLSEFRRLAWQSGRPQPLPVYGPDGVEQVVSGVNEAFAADDRYRTALSGGPPPNLAARPFGLADPLQRNDHMGRRVIFDDGTLRITAFQVNHEPVYPAVGYRFDYGGRSVVISGDTVPHRNVVKMAKNVDLLIHEAQSDAMVDAVRRGFTMADKKQIAAILGKIDRYHTTPSQAARVANEAGARMLVFNHLGPMPPGNPLTRAVFVRGTAKVRDPELWRLGEEGMTIDLPAGSTAIRFGTL